MFDIKNFTDDLFIHDFPFSVACVKMKFVFRLSPMHFKLFRQFFLRTLETYD